MTEEEIIANAKKAHDELTRRYYSETPDDGGMLLTRAGFDQLHGDIWNKLAADLIAAGFRQPSIEPRDLAAEIDSLEGRIRKLEPRLP